MSSPVGPLNNIVSTRIHPSTAQNAAEVAAIPISIQQLMIQNPAAPAALLNPPVENDSVDVEAMIQQGRQFILEQTGSDELFTMLDSIVLPGLVNWLERSIPDWVTDRWYVKPAIKLALWKSRLQISQSIEATLLRVIINIIKDAKGNSLQKSSTADILKELINHIAKMGNSNIETVQAKIAQIDCDPTLSADRKNLEKTKLFQEIAVNLLKVGLPHKEKDIIVSNLRGLSAYFNVPATLYDMIEKMLPTKLMEFSSTLGKAYSAEKKDSDAINSHKEGGAELLDLLKLTSKQIGGVLNQQLSARADALGALINNSEISKLVAGLSKDLGMNSPAQLDKMLHMLGDYFRPILIHIGAKLLEGKAADDKRHVVTYIVEELIKSFYAFFAQEEKTLDAAYQAYEAAISTIDQTQMFMDPAIRDQNKADARKTLDALFATFAANLMKRFGCDAESLESILPFGGAACSELIKSFIIEYAFQFYRDVIRVQNEESPHAAATQSLEKVVDIFIPSMKETLADPKTHLSITLIQSIQSHLFEGKVGASKEFFEKPLAEIVQTKAWENVSRSSNAYLKKMLMGLISNWATQYNKQTGNAPLSIGAAGITHAINIVATEVKDPQLAEKLASWKAMAESTKEEQTAKEAQKTELLKLFALAATRLVSDGGWDNERNILAPQSFKKGFKNTVKDSLLPEMLFGISCDMLVAKSPTKSQANLTGIDRLNKLGVAIYDLSKSNVRTTLTDFNDVIADQINQLSANAKDPKLAKKQLSVREEIALAADLEDIGSNKGPGMQKAMSFVDGLAERMITSGLQNMAAKGSNKGDALTNLLLHFRKRMAEQKIDKKIVPKLQKYLQITQGLSDAQEKLSQLRKKGVEKLRLVQSETDATKTSVLESEYQNILHEIESQQLECQSKEQQINADLADKYQKLNQVKLAKKLEKETKLHDKLAVLQNKMDQLHVAVVAKFHESHNEVDPAKKVALEAELNAKRAEIETLKEAHNVLKSEIDNLHTIQGKYQKLRKAFAPVMQTLLQDMGYDKPSDLPVPFFLQNTLWDSLQKVILPEVAIKLYAEFTRSSRQQQQHIVNLHNRFDTINEKGEMVPTKMIEAAWNFATTAMQYVDNYLVVETSDIADLVADSFDIAYKHEAHVEGNAVTVDRHLLGKTAPGLQEFVMPALHHELHGLFLKVFDHVTGTIEKIEKEDPKKLYKMTVALLSEMAQHLEFVNRVTKELGYTHMHEVPALDMLKAFETAGKLHKGTPGHFLQNEIAKTQAELKLATGEKAEELKTKLASLESDAIEWSSNYFYRQFTIDILKLVGFSSAKDLPIRASLQDKTWNLLIDKLGPKMFNITAKKVGSSAIVNKSLATLLDNLNKNLQEAFIRSPAVEKYQEAMATQDDATKARRLQEFDKLVNGIAVKLNQKAELISESIMHDYKPADKAEDEADPKLQATLENLLAQLGLALPGTWLGFLTQWKQLRSLSGVQLEKILHSTLQQWTLLGLAETAILSTAENLPKEPLPVTPEEVAIAKEAAVKLDMENQKKVTNGLLDLVSYEKETLAAGAQKNMFTAFLHWIFSPLLNLIFSHLEGSVKENAPHGRKNIADTEIHGNMFYYLVDNIRWMNQGPVRA